ncbi:MAG TPA: class I SAM-dependent methyltransferase [Acidimicrobiales bacterium]
MRLKMLQDNWNRMGEQDPLWAVASDPDYRGGRWDEDAFFATGRETITTVLDEAAARGLEVPRGAAFDFGCGVGRLSQALADHFEQVTGADIAPAMLEHARGYNRHGDHVTYVLNDRPDLSRWESSSFDFVLSEITLMHMEPKYFCSYIAEFLRICRPGGLIVFQLPGRRRRQAIREKIPGPIWDLVMKVRTRRSPRMEIYGMDPPALREFVAEHGGRVEDEVELELEGVHEINRRYFVRPSA